MGTSANSRVAGWRLEDIDDNLAADFDGSLSGLGVDLSVASYNMRSVTKLVYILLILPLCGKGIGSLCPVFVGSLEKTSSLWKDSLPLKLSVSTKGASPPHSLTTVPVACPPNRLLIHTAIRNGSARLTMAGSYGGILRPVIHDCPD